MTVDLAFEGRLQTALAGPEGGGPVGQAVSLLLENAVASGVSDVHLNPTGQGLEVLFRVREESGGWNDRVFARSENFGTAMSILSIMQPDMPLPARWRETIDAGAKTGR